MYKIKILSVGKNKEKWLETAILEYAKRLSPFAYMEFLWVKDDNKLIETVNKEIHPIFLDITGKMVDSEQFADLLFKILEERGSRLTFVIGGAEGIPPKLVRKTSVSLSLSRMTFTHQLARLVLVEQIYRAFEIFKGSDYHK